MYKKLLVAVDLQDAKGTEATLLALNDYVAPGMEVELVAVLPGFKMPLVASYFPEDMVKAGAGYHADRTYPAGGCASGERDECIGLGNGW